MDLLSFLLPWGKTNNVNVTMEQRILYLVYSFVFEVHNNFIELGLFCELMHTSPIISLDASVSDLVHGTRKHLTFHHPTRMSPIAFRYG